MNTYTKRREMPRHTCPDIDQIIAALEELRRSNAALREIAEEALDFADKETRRADEESWRAAEQTRRADEQTERADSAEREVSVLYERIYRLEEALVEARRIEQ